MLMGKAAQLVLGQGFDGAQINGEFGVGFPENPEFSIGLDGPLMELKMEILEDGVSVIALTGFGGSGKTTLTTGLCWDDEMRDETCNSNLCNVQEVEAEVLILNLHTKQYSLPEFTEKMSEQKTLIVTNYGLHPSELNNIEIFGTLSDLKMLRLEQISVPPLGTLKNLRKLSLNMCNTSQAFENSGIPISDALPNLFELSIEYCIDMVELPTGICDITPLKTLSISNCHKLSVLPQQIGNLENLEVLRLRCCSDLVEIPDSIGWLSNLRLLDISDCISLRNLPEDIGNLYNLRNLYMTNCTRCELPFSVINLEHLKVMCDEETAASWGVFKPMLPNLQIEVPQVNVNLSWLHAI